RQAVATADAAARALDMFAPGESPPAFVAKQRALATALAETAAQVAPGWLSVSLDPPGAPLPPIGTEVDPQLAVRIGVASPLPNSRFPVIVPLLGCGHLAIDATRQDVRTAGLLRSVVLRLIAATTPGALRVRVVDPTGVVFTPFSALFDGRLM